MMEGTYTEDEKLVLKQKGQYKAEIIDALLTLLYDTIEKEVHIGFKYFTAEETAREILAQAPIPTVQDCVRMIEEKGHTVRVYDEAV